MAFIKGTWTNWGIAGPILSPIDNASVLQCQCAGRLLLPSSIIAAATLLLLFI